MPGRRPDSTDQPASFEVRLSPKARRQYQALPDVDRDRVRADLLALARQRPGRGGKALKTLRGIEGDFHRLRVGDWRVMYDLIPEDKFLLVLGIVNRKDLERWIRTQRR